MEIVSVQSVIQMMQGLVNWSYHCDCEVVRDAGICIIYVQKRLSVKEVNMSAIADYFLLAFMSGLLVYGFNKAVLQDCLSMVVLIFSLCRLLQQCLLMFEFQCRKN